MESPALLLVLVPLLLLALSPAAATDTAVLDTKGNPVLSDDSYIVLIALPANGINVAMAATPEECPRNVVLENQRIKGAVVFRPEKDRQNKTILLEELLFIMFVKISPSPESTHWTVNDTTGIVTTGGRPPGPNDGYNYFGFFRIGNYEMWGPNYYQLYSCPTPVPERQCSSIGVTSGDVLSRSPAPIIVQFEKLRG